MLLNLDIKNAAIIEHLSLDIEDGLTVLTGETGAGKSVIIGTINLLLGARGNKDLVRYGEKKAVLQAVFYTEDTTALEENGIETEDGNVIITREIFSDGKSICRINGMIVPQNIVKEITGNFINIHGQHDSQALLNPAKHIDFLDSYAKNNDLLADYEEVYKRKNEIETALKSLEMDEAEKARKVELLTYQIEEISLANLKVGEKQTLSEQKELIRNGEKISHALSSAHESLYNGEKSAYDEVGDANNSLLKIASLDKRFEEISTKVNEILYGLEDVSHDIYEALSANEYDEETLNEIESRLDIINKLERKYGQGEETILKFLENAQRELSMITDSDKEREKLLAELSDVKNELLNKANVLTKSRENAGKTLAELIKKELFDLDMQSADFRVEIQSLADFSKKGTDKVEFLISTNKGEPLKPFEKIASGGELSRVMLAIKGILADSDNTDTLIFDEIDTGVSGSAAQKIAKKLSALADKKQVICISHQPQLAAAADNHYMIKKSEQGERVTTTAVLLKDEERVKEIARITDGDNISELSMAHAREMLCKY